ncbi:MAG: hypothetical protein J6Y47_07700 [Bacteroidales bacterium]|nr:hypothetical protein [Bacteroidales bacterium]
MDSNLKEQLIEACLLQQQKIAEEKEKAANELQEQINAYGQNKDRYDSFRTKLTRSKEQLQLQQLQAMNTLKALYQIPKESRQKVEYGAIVVTDKQRFFIAVGMGKITCAEKDYFVISAAAPIFAVMQGKKVNDEFTFNKVKHKITAIL